MSETQVSASMVFESRAKKRRVSINQACCQNLGGPRGSEAQVSASMVLESRAKKRRVCINQACWGASGQPGKVIKFQASLQGNKRHVNWSQVHQKSWKIDSGIMRNPISAKIDFCNISLAKCLFFKSPTSRFGPKSHQKKKPGDKHEQTHLFWPKVPKKLSKWVPKSNKNQQKSKPGPPSVISCASQ